MQQIGKSAMRVAKNSIKGYSDVQTKVRDATSNDPWGPSGTQMSEVAALTFNPNDFVEIIEMLDKRLNDKGKNWRHVFKSLTLLDYCLHAGSENVVQYFRENIYIIKTLKEFQFIDEFGKDQGANVRQKAKDITNLLLDESRMKHQRANRKDMRDRMAGERPRSADTSQRRQEPDRRGAKSVPSGDRDLEAAIAASKASAEEEARRGGRGGGGGDNELEEAMRLSREEDERRKRELAASQGGSLFDEQQQTSNSNNLIDIDAQPQQPMQTGWASFNPYAAQQQAQMEEQMRQAQMMELQRQQQEQQQYQYMQQQQQLQQQYAQQHAQEQYMAQQRQQYEQQLAYQSQQQPQPLQPQPTAFGTNNPFAAFAPTPAQSPPPALPQSTSYTGFQQAPSPAPAPARQQTPKDDGKHAELARMLAGGREDGVDTFGNTGIMRVPVGQQFATRTGGLQAQPTGLKGPNPFSQPQQRQQFNQPQQQQQQQQQSDSPFFTI